MWVTDRSCHKPGTCLPRAPVQNMDVAWPLWVKGALDGRSGVTCPEGRLPTVQRIKAKLANQHPILVAMRGIYRMRRHCARVRNRVHERLSHWPPVKPDSGCRG